MAPGIVFRCLLCRRMLKTVKGLEDHHRKIHGVTEVTSEHYKLLFLKNPPVVNGASGASAVIKVSSGKVKVEGAARGRLDGDSGGGHSIKGPGGGGAGPSGSKKGVFKTPILPPKSNNSEDKLPPIAKFEEKTSEPSHSVSPPSNPSTVTSLDTPPSAGTPEAEVSDPTKKAPKTRPPKKDSKKPKTFDYFKGYTTSGVAVEGLAMWSKKAKKSPPVSESATDCIILEGKENLSPALPPSLQRPSSGQKKALVKAQPSFATTMTSAATTSAIASPITSAKCRTKGNLSTGTLLASRYLVGAVVLTSPTEAEQKTNSSATPSQETPNTSVVANTSAPELVKIYHNLLPALPSAENMSTVTTVHNRHPEEGLSGNLESASEHQRLAEQELSQPNRKQQKVRMRGKKATCDDVACLPCSISVNCNECFFCLNRAKLK